MEILPLLDQLDRLVSERGDYALIRTGLTKLRVEIEALQREAEDQRAAREREQQANRENEQLMGKKISDLGKLVRDLDAQNKATKTKRRR